MKCGIDPGRHKIGFALVEANELLFSAIIPKADEERLRETLVSQSWENFTQWRQEGSLERLNGRKLQKICVGDGTSSSEIICLLEKELTIEVTDEKGTTLEGRKRYWLLHPPRGLWRLVPVSLRVPPRDIDDLAAWALIR